MSVVDEEADGSLESNDLSRSFPALQGPTVSNLGPERPMFGLGGKGLVHLVLWSR